MGSEQQINELIASIDSALDQVNYFLISFNGIKNQYTG